MINEAEAREAAERASAMFATDGLGTSLGPAVTAALAARECDEERVREIVREEWAAIREEQRAEANASRYASLAGAKDTLDRLRGLATFSVADKVELFEAMISMSVIAPPDTQFAGGDPAGPGQPIGGVL